MQPFLVLLCWLTVTAFVGVATLDAEVVGCGSVAVEMEIVAVAHT